MKNKFFAILKKELLVVSRDKIGLIILFLMPMVLILVMSLIQDNAFKSMNEDGIGIVLVNNDKDSLGNAIQKGLSESPLCVLTENIHGKKATTISTKKAVAEGEFMLGIIIPEGATKAIRSNVTTMVEESIGTATNPSNKTEKVEVIFYVDPIAKKSMVRSISANIHEFISEMKNKIMFEAFSEQMNEMIPDGGKTPNNVYSRSQIIQYKEVPASDLIGESIPDSVQHNVPAWTIFGMFFIVISVVGNVMKEKKEGSVIRMKTMPVSYFMMINGKVLVFASVCFVQFLIMIAVGKLVLPWFGMASLSIGTEYFAILLLALATAFAATGFGIFVGTLASTEQQGAIMGSLFILLLSAIGGILVPTYVMPQIMRKVSVISPLNWSLDGFYKLFLRGEGMLSILPNVALLFGFFILTLIGAIMINRIKNRI